MDEYNDLQSQHQSDREQWLEQCIEEQEWRLEYAFVVRENEYEQKQEHYRKWVF